jgi:hypothetical protein
MNINEAFPSKYLKASDLQDREVAVVIGRIEMETIGTDRRMLLYFNGKDKALVCNKTNATSIAKGYGQDTDNWIGKPIVLFSAYVDFKGESVEAIRIKLKKAGTAGAPVPPPQGNGNSTADLDDAVPFK